MLVLADRVGNRPFMFSGLALQAGGLGWLAAVARPGVSYGTLVAPLIVAGIGIAMCFPTVANAVTASVPDGDVGVAAGTNNALNALGGVFGVAILAAVFAARGSYASPAAFIDGFRPAEWTAAAVAAVGVPIAALAPAGIRGLGLDAAQDRGVTETAVPAETSAGTAGCDVALCLRRDVPALGQEPQHEQRFADERDGGDIDGVARYEQCAGAADQVAGAGDDEKDTENPGNIA